MSITAAPATSEIMTSVPLSKAGVGSAVNDTTRELGGALGIALLGSIANTAYRSGVDLEQVRLPDGTREAAGESIGAASAIAERIPGGGGEVVAQASSAFTNAFTLTNTVAMGIALAAAAAVLAVSRRSGGDTVEADVVDDDVIEAGDLELLPVGAGEMRE
jgi:hypothetical protein